MHQRKGTVKLMTNCMPWCPISYTDLNLQAGNLMSEVKISHLNSHVLTRQEDSTDLDL